MAGKPNPRRRNGSRRDKLRKAVAAEGLPCHICGKAIDYTLPPGHPMSYELDEVIPVSKGGSPFDRKNVAPAHRVCNNRRGNRSLDAARSGARANASEAEAKRNARQSNSLSLEAEANASVEASRFIEEEKINVLGETRKGFSKGSSCERERRQGLPLSQDW